MRVVHESCDKQIKDSYQRGYRDGYKAALELQPNDPLTLRQLREMDGEPVYLDFADGGEWVLVRAYEGKVFITHKNTICSPANLVLMCRGKICRRKPEEGET